MVFGGGRSLGSARQTEETTQINQNFCGSLITCRIQDWRLAPPIYQVRHNRWFGHIRGDNGMGAPRGSSVQRFTGIGKNRVTAITDLPSVKQDMCRINLQKQLSPRSGLFPPQLSSPSITMQPADNVDHSRTTEVKTRSNSDRIKLITLKESRQKFSSLKPHGGATSLPLDMKPEHVCKSLQSAVFINSRDETMGSMAVVSSPLGCGSSTLLGNKPLPRIPNALISNFSDLADLDSGLIWPNVVRNRLIPDLFLCISAKILLEG